jgi:hypothetical protein
MFAFKKNLALNVLNVQVENDHNFARKNVSNKKIEKNKTEKILTFL